jgi:hypothetical protein
MGGMSKLMEEILFLMRSQADGLAAVLIWAISIAFEGDIIDLDTPCLSDLVKRWKDGRLYDPGNITLRTEWAVNGSILQSEKDEIELRGEKVKRRLDRWLEGKRA